MSWDLRCRPVSLLQVCSPGQICRDVAAQMALAEARNGSVLWMALGSHAAAYGSSVLQQVRYPGQDGREPIDQGAYGQALGRTQRVTYSLLTRASVDLRTMVMGSYVNNGPWLPESCGCSRGLRPVHA